MSEIYQQRDSTHDILRKILQNGTLAGGSGGGATASDIGAANLAAMGANPTAAAIAAANLAASGANPTAAAIGAAVAAPSAAAIGAAVAAPSAAAIASAIGITTGQVGGLTSNIQYVPGSNNGIYAAGDAIGVDTELSGALRSATNLGVLISLHVFDVDNQKSAIDFWFLDRDFTTAASNNAAYTLSATDYPRLLGMVSVVAADYVTSGSFAFATKLNVGLSVKANASGSIWVLPICRGTPTYATGATALSFRFGFIQD